jgi:hypothetical protein
VNIQRSPPRDRDSSTSRTLGGLNHAHTTSTTSLGTTPRRHSGRWMMTAGNAGGARRCPCWLQAWAGALKTLSTARLPATYPELSNLNPRGRRNVRDHGGGRLRVRPGCRTGGASEQAKRFGRAARLAEPAAPRGSCPASLARRHLAGRFRRPNALRGAPPGPVSRGHMWSWSSYQASWAGGSKS